MAVSKQDILETIANMSVMDVVELIEQMEKKFNVSAAAVAVAAPAASAATVSAAEEKTEFDVILKRQNLYCCSHLFQLNLIGVLESLIISHYLRVVIIWQKIIGKFIIGMHLQK